jgi:site-specific DNA-cytosine methylase
LLTSLDLFSDIGCHAIGFERAGIGTVAMCEVNPSRRAVLARHFPGVPVYGDVREFEGVPAGIIIGGPPCQQTSVASAIYGKRSGASLWPEMGRICDDMGPEWIVVEQPPGNAEWEAQIADDLCCSGYHSARIEFGACDVGAPYLRRRVFILACAGLPRLEVAWRSVPSAIECVKRAADARGDWHPDKLRALRVDARSAGEMERSESAIRKERIEAIANPPHMAEVIGRAIVAAS